MSIPSDRKFLKSHEWHKTDGSTCIIGITQFAADELTDITYVDLPEVGTSVTAGEPFGEIESVKATGDLVSGVSGEVIEVNADLANDPSLVNSHPHDDGWMIKVKLSDPAELEKLLTPEQYESQSGAG